MIIDALLQWDPPNTDLAIAQGTQDSTNIIDVGIIDGIPSEANGGGARDMGIGDKPALKCSVIVGEAFTSAGGTVTVQVAIQGAPDNGSGAPGSFVTLATGPAFVAPAIGVNLLPIDLPRVSHGIMPRFYKLVYTIGVQDATNGAVSAQLVLDEISQAQQDPGVLGGYRPGLVVNN